jgi:CHAD domain-containing protein
LNGRKTGPRFREVEVEASSADLRQLRRIARVISRAGAQPDQRSKLAKALALNGVSVPDPLLSPPAPSAPIELGIRFALQSAAQALLVADPQARAGDVEGLHQLRVATRRLRSVLRTFGPVVDPALREAVPGRFAWLGQASGMVRDLDVLIESLQAVADDEADSIAPLLAELSERQQIAASALRVCMDSAAYLEFARQLQVLRAVPEPDGPSAGSCHTQARLMLARPARDLRRGLRALPADPADEDLHRIRILAKRARYAGEICELLSKPAAAREYRAFSRRAEAMQNILGRHHDAIVAQSVLLAVAARESGDRRFFVAVGRLIEREAQAARDAHDEFLLLKDSLERKKHLWPAT